MVVDGQQLIIIEAMKMQNSSKDVCLKFSKERWDSAKASSSRRRGIVVFIASHIVEGVFGQPCRLIRASVTTWLCARIRSVSPGWNNQLFGTSFPLGGGGCRLEMVLRVTTSALTSARLPRSPLSKPSGLLGLPQFAIFGKSRTPMPRFPHPVSHSAFVFGGTFLARCRSL